MAELTIEQLKDRNRQLQLEIELKKELIKTEQKHYNCVYFVY